MHVISHPPQVPTLLSIWVPLSSSIPDEWSRVGPVGPSEQLELTFALRQQGVDLLGETLRRVSDPDSPQYGTAVCSLFIKTNFSLRSPFSSPSGSRCQKLYIAFFFSIKHFC